MIHDEDCVRTWSQILVDWTHSIAFRGECIREHRNLSCHRKWLHTHTHKKKKSSCWLGEINFLKTLAVDPLKATPPLFLNFPRMEHTHFFFFFSIECRPRNMYVLRHAERWQAPPYDDEGGQSGPSKAKKIININNNYVI